MNTWKDIATWTAVIRMFRDLVRRRPGRAETAAGGSSAYRLFGSGDGNYGDCEAVLRSGDEHRNSIMCSENDLTVGVPLKQTRWISIP